VLVRDRQAAGPGSSAANPTAILVFPTAGGSWQRDVDWARTNSRVAGSRIFRASAGQYGRAMNQLIERAIDLAIRNAERGQLPFGALVVRDGAVIAEGINTALRDHDPIAHGEVAAVRNACRKFGVLHLTGLVVVSSCEPCAICHAVCAGVGVTRILYAAPKGMVPDLGYPAPDPGPLPGRMQVALRALAPEQLEHVPSERAAEPFMRYLARKAGA
jgi:guanine deaminase